MDKTHNIFRICPTHNILRICTTHTIRICTKHIIFWKFAQHTQYFENLPNTHNILRICTTHIIFENLPNTHNILRLCTTHIIFWEFAQYVCETMIHSQSTSVSLDGSQTEHNLPIILLNHLLVIKRADVKYISNIW